MNVVMVTSITRNHVHGATQRERCRAAVLLTEMFIEIGITEDSACIVLALVRTSVNDAMEMDIYERIVLNVAELFRLIRNPIKIKLERRVQQNEGYIRKRSGTSFK